MTMLVKILRQHRYQGTIKNPGDADYTVSDKDGQGMLGDGTVSWVDAPYVNPDTIGESKTLTAAQIANPTANILADTVATYIGPAPDYFRYASNGVILSSLSGELSIPTKAVGQAPPGTIASNGTVTFSTALDRIWSEGIFLQYASSAFSTLNAGFYYTVMSSTTVGQVFETQGGSLVVGSNVAYLLGSGPQTMASIIIPANTLKNRGRLEATCSWISQTATVDMDWHFGGTALTRLSKTFTRGVARLRLYGISTTRQLAHIDCLNSTALTAPTQQIITIDTTIDQVLELGLLAGNNWVIAESAIVTTTGIV
jgi:hypothetical protein